MIAWFYFSHFVLDIYNSLLDLIMPEIAAKIGISVGLGVFVLNVVYITGNVLQPVWGYMADKMTRKFFVFWGLILAAVFFPLTSIAPDFNSLILLVLLGAIGISFYHPQSMGCVSNKVGMFLMAGSLGFSVAPIITLNIVKNYGFEYIPYISIIGILTAFSMLLIPSKNTPLARKKAKKVSFKIILRKKRMRNLAIISVSVGSIIAIVGQLSPFLWKEIGRDMSYSGMGLFLFYMAGGIGGALVEKIRKKLGRVNTFYSGLIMLSLSILLFVLTLDYQILSLFFLVIVGFVSMGLIPLLVTTGQQVLPMYKSSVAGVIGGFCYAMACIVAVAIGFIADFIGIVPTLIHVSAIPLICSFLIKKIKINFYFVNLKKKKS